MKNPLLTLVGQCSVLLALAAWLAPLPGCASSHGHIHVGVDVGVVKVDVEHEWGDQNASTNGSQQTHSGQSNLSIDGADLGIALEDGEFTDALDEADTIAVSATIPVALSGAEMSNLSQAYPGIASIAVHDGQTEMSFSGTVPAAFALLADMGFHSIEVPLTEFPEGAVTMSGTVAAISGNVVHIGLERHSASVRSISYNGYSVGRVESRVALTEVQSLSAQSLEH